MSHTTTVNIELRDRAALAAAVTALGGHVLGEGRYSLFSSQETGWGFTLPNWQYPLILRKEDNSLAMDTFNGRWGDEIDLVKLKGMYAVEAARSAANNLGWVTEKQADGSLLIYHPTGATLTVTRGGTVDANGFVGEGCNVAAAIESALGQTLERTNKAEFFAERAHQREV